MQSPFYYHLIKPNSVDFNKKYPAIFLMHGMGSNEEDLPPLVQSFQDQLYIFSIRGPIVQPPGYAFFSFKELGKPEQVSFNDALQKLEKFLSFAIEQYPIDEKRLFLLGFSQGAIISMSYAIKNPKKIKGVLALSGYVPLFIQEAFHQQSLEQLNFFVSHGEQDPVLPFTWGNESVNFLRKLGAHITFKSYKAGHWVTDENLKDLQIWLNEQLAK